MWLVRRENNVADFPRTFGRFFDDFWRSDWPSLQNIEEDSVVWAPRMDIEETEDSYLVRADLPGIDKKDLKVSLNDNVLTIKGERKHENEEKSKNVFRMERTYGNFQRTCTLPAKVKSNDIKADYKDGVLTVTLPKADEVKPKLIEIR
jgi:HSP20 family protein